MEVRLLNYTPLEVADIAICKCYANEPHKDIEKVKARISRVANVSKHSSTIEHISYSLDIDGISRACLQELARHRIASYTVKSTRYTLHELKKETRFYWEDENINDDNIFDRAGKYVVFTKNIDVDNAIISSLDRVRELVVNGISNDLVKYSLPEAYKTSLIMTINARTLQNFLELRSSKFALWEIQNLAKAIYEALPEDHKFLYDYIFNKEDNK